VTDDYATTEQALRVALREAADQITVNAPTEPSPAPEAKRSPPIRIMALVAGIAVLVTAVVLGVGLMRGDHGPSVSPAATTPTEVSPDAIPSASADLVVFMRVGASDAQIAAVHDLISTTPEVREFASLSQDDAYREFAHIFECNPDLVHSIAPKDLPRSFRLIGVTSESLARLRTNLVFEPGVDTVEPGGAPQATPQSCTPASATGSPTAPPTPVTPTLPPADGTQPADPDTARSEIIGAYTQAFTGTNPVDVRRNALQDGAALTAQLDQANAAYGPSIDSMTVQISDVRILDTTHAAVIFTLTLNGTAQSPALGYAILDGEHWKVSRNTICAILPLAQVQCPS